MSKFTVACSCGISNPLFDSKEEAETYLHIERSTMSPYDDS